MKNILGSMSVLVVSALFPALDSSASLVLPDAEFAFSAPVLDAPESAEIMERAVMPLGFRITRRPHVREDGFFRAEFERGPSTGVSLAGRVSCIHVGIYTSLSKEPEPAAAVVRAATELQTQILAALRASEQNVLLFKSAAGKSACEEAL